jgi:hypothetical protein
MPPRRFPPPWWIEERQESFIVKDATHSGRLPLILKPNTRTIGQPSTRYSGSSTTATTMPRSRPRWRIACCRFPASQRVMKAFPGRPTRPAGTIERARLNVGPAPARNPYSTPI